MLAEVRGWSLRRAESTIGDVRQRALMGCRTIDELGNDSAVRALACELERVLAHAVDIVGSDEPLRLAEATAMLYRGPSAGITAHRDRRAHRLLVVIVSLSGNAELDIVERRDDEHPAARVACGPGDIVLLRGPGLGGELDGRPLHRARAPRDGERLSLTFRTSRDDA